MNSDLCIYVCFAYMSICMCGGEVFLGDCSLYVWHARVRVCWVNCEHGGHLYTQGLLCVCVDSDVFGS